MQVPPWALDSMDAKNFKQNKCISSSSSSNNNNNHNDNSKNTNNKSIGNIVIPYIQSLGKSFKNICGMYFIQTYFKGNRTLKDILVSTKGKDPMEQEVGLSIGKVPEVGLQW